MENQPEKENGPEPENPFKISIQVTESNDGTLGMNVIGKAVRLVEVRRLLEWALNRTNDEIHTEVTNRLLEQQLEKKAHKNGFRPISLRGILGR